MRTVGHQPTTSNHSPTTRGTHLAAAAWLTLAVFVACIVGIYTRPAGLLASVWPANAVMVGLLIRWPAASSAIGWIGAAAAYVAADLLTGSPVFKAAVLNGANLVSVGVVSAIYARLPIESARLQGPTAVVHLLFASAAAGAAAGIVGGLTAPLSSPSGVLSAWAFWLATEFVNYVAILPVILAAPARRSLRVARPRARPGMAPTDTAPMVALLASCAAGLVIGGPGSLAFPVPALLWCGLAYAMFPTAVLTLCFSAWALMSVAFGYLPNPAEAYDQGATISARLGVSFIALAPILIASVMEGRDEQLTRMHRLAAHDPLTGLVNRGAFRDHASIILAEQPRSVAMLMIDVDHFKVINDGHGHACGDAVLVTFARRVRDCLRAEDLFARLGGDEFAVLITGRADPDLPMMAGRIRAAVASTPFVFDDGRSMSVTVSIGMVVASGEPPASIAPLLADADAALYLAKANGRNRVEVIRGPSGNNGRL